ncbi:Nucleoside phosphorylase domain and Uridine phosphorylase, eukaryotic family-containing protein [Strongyloides ratti]|uniref:Nucleoside phosphorylase domain and Uridine phosphorylase, eukaryotic family-containing protein n=1 Tax=Strongyloides ratti TaxID=34506 RepID=A0A090L803_STRRB|nr:Nucleoside phosphorylase domain and Uridine phosphorylase, eukaryotic family-containing protein [Strongyloides ratti]CEF64218.1 Nucleoside phosphorylase domain and Uridine phosphorylase, eukaryotic family-containing protein [Strongyloides ratti]
MDCCNKGESCGSGKGSEACKKKCGTDCKCTDCKCGASCQCGDNCKCGPDCNFIMLIEGSGINITNKFIQQTEKDFLYHFGLDKQSDAFDKTFKDVKIICTGGCYKRIENYAMMFAKEVGLPTPKNMCKSYRYVLFKTGPILWISHGIGSASLSIMLIETIKLLYHAKATDVSYIRIGTSGGIGVDGGTVIISSGGVNGELKQEHIQYVLGEKVTHSATLDRQLQQELVETAKKLEIPYDTGLTLCADDFYEGQGRLDGAFCNYTEEDKFKFLEKIYKIGVRNFEMESTCFASLLNRANIKAAIICVALLNRLKGDQIDIDNDTYHDFEMRPYRIVCQYLKNKFTF